MVPSRTSCVTDQPANPGLTAVVLNYHCATSKNTYVATSKRNLILASFKIRCQLANVTNGVALTDEMVGLTGWWAYPVQRRGPRRP